MNTLFVRKEFQYWGGYLTYGPERKFVGRFKHQGSKSANAFARFLVKNFTVEEYFSAREAGHTPLGLLEAKGFVLPHILAWLKAGTLKDWHGQGYTYWKARQ